MVMGQSYELTTTNKQDGNVWYHGLQGLIQHMVPIAHPLAHSPTRRPDRVQTHTRTRTHTRIRTHARARTHAHPPTHPPTHTHTHRHRHTHARTHAQAHTHTHTGAWHGLVRNEVRFTPERALQESPLYAYRRALLGATQNHRSTVHLHWYSVRHSHRVMQLSLLYEGRPTSSEGRVTSSDQAKTSEEAHHSNNTRGCAQTRNAAPCPRWENAEF
jgi:hypothetical protein